VSPDHTSGSRWQNLAMDAVTPRLRGIFHLGAFVAYLAAGTVLVVLADGIRATTAAWVFAAALVAMFGASALYHRFPWRSAVRRLWARRLDHAAIYVLIAGTYTAFALLALSGQTQAWVLAATWGGALLGLVLTLVWVDAPRWLRVASYVAVGWVGALTVPELFGLGVATAVLVIVGGGLYTAGALTYASRWPNPLPSWFGFHEVFHLLVIAAATTHFVGVSLVLM
jgi:hemolysin III